MRIFQPQIGRKIRILGMKSTVLIFLRKSLTKQHATWST